MLNLLTTEKLVIATHNAGKLQEISDILSPILPSVTTLSSAALGLSEPEETGVTFAENAAIKSKTAAKESGIIALADDSGLEVDVLGNAPGIYSARLAGEAKDFSSAMDKIKTSIEALGQEPNGQSARFICVLSISNPAGDTIHFAGKVEGSLTFPPRGEQGFGYDPIFIPNGELLTFAEINPVAKHKISHRADAFAKFIKYIEREKA